MMCLIGRSDTCTDRLLRTIAQAHADLARHRAIGPWRPEPIVQSVTSSTRRIAYLAGGVTRGVLQASSVLQNHNLKKVEVWLIIRCSEDQCDDDVGSHAVQEFVNSGRLLRLNPTTSDQEQAESIRKLGLDVMFLICPPEGFESILARHPACNLVNWLGLSGTRCNLCDYHIVCTSGLRKGLAPRSSMSWSGAFEPPPEN